MKKLIILILGTTIILSCTRDDDSKNNYTMVGKWKHLKSESYTTKDNKTTTFANSECSQKSVHEFKADNKAISIIYESVNGVCTQTDIDERTYAFNKENMTFTQDGYTDYPYYIIKLNNSEMVFEYRLDDLDSDGKNDIIRYYFVKL